MSKKIEDFLPFYLGCECNLMGEVEDNHDEPVVPKRFKLNGIVNRDGTIFCLCDDAEYHHEVEASEIFIHLRPLSDITEEEARHFAWLCMDSEQHLEKDCRVTIDEIQIELAKNDDGLQLDNDVEIYIGVNCRCFEGYVAIMKDGRIGIAEEDQPSTEMKPVEDIASKVAYLLFRKFDLFNLIPEGLALFPPPQGQPIFLPIHKE